MMINIAFFSFSLSLPFLFFNDSFNFLALINKILYLEILSFDNRYICFFLVGIHGFFSLNISIDYLHLIIKNYGDDVYLLVLHNCQYS